jgi:hypothetical protein
MAICSDLLDIAYIRYNAAHFGAEIDIFPNIDPDRNCLVYNFKSGDSALSSLEFQSLNLGPRYKLPKFTDSYRFALSRPELDGALVALDTPAHIDALVRALATGPLPPARVEYMKNLWLLASGRATVDRS